MDSLYTSGVQQIFTLQNVFTNYNTSMIGISKVFDPNYAFFLYTPVLFAFDFRAGKSILWTTVLTEWANQILKWLLFGERPYWWSLEYVDTHQGMPQLQQFSVTCETGPGSPSGHAMITAAIFYIIFDYITRKIKILQVPIWTAYMLMIFSVSMSRLFIAAHFPHQVVVGAVLGYMIANLVLKSSFKVEQASRSNYIWTTVFLFISALATYFSLNLLGFDADWSVKKAIEFCQRPEWIHLSTSPLFTLMRYTGFLLGFGLGLHSKMFLESSKFNRTVGTKLVTVLVSICITKFSELIVQPKSDIYLLYIFGFVMSCSLGFVYSAISPWIAAKICLANRKQF
ncbi:glucose-6-phosphatase 2-like [Bradysia coprophila]|uniref:glucose-6-phosphatase 2-like n=1 Tax=Bradysia coprophila TaxID=38358 RepID=UPI00187DA6EB|nr:glucose-6-phosphatase 2-like [Bradysia coprophila]